MRFPGKEIEGKTHVALSIVASLLFLALDSATKVAETTVVAESADDRGGPGIVVGSSNVVCDSVLGPHGQPQVVVPVACGQKRKHHTSIAHQRWWGQSHQPLLARAAISFGVVGSRRRRVEGQ